MKANKTNSWIAFGGTTALRKSGYLRFVFVIQL
jgi:hypothetical protein